eukprot:gene42287-51638_t
MLLILLLLVISVCVSTLSGLEISAFFSSQSRKLLSALRIPNRARAKAAAVAASFLCLQPITTMAVNDDTAISRFKQAKLELVDLDKNWDSVVQEDLDVVEFEEPARELLEALNQADFLAYSSIFSEYGNGGGGADYIKDSHAQVKRAVLLMDDVLKSIEQ